MKKLAIAIFVLCLLEALCFFWSGWWGYSAFRSAGATSSQAFAIAESSWQTGILIVLGGFLHGVVPRLRMPLAVAGVFGGFYAASLIIKSLPSWNRMHGSIITVGIWSEAILIVLALACAAELALMARGAK